MTILDTADLHPVIILAEKLAKLEDIVEKLELRIFELENKISDWPAGPFQVPDDAPGLDTICRVCSIDWGGAMGYCCSRTDCPMQAHVSDIIFEPLNPGG